MNSTYTPSGGEMEQRLRLNEHVYTRTGREQWDEFTSRVGIKPKTFVQYDYRSPDGRLFSCVRPKLHDCRKLRRLWEQKNGLKS